MSVDKFLSGLPIIGGLFDDSEDQAMEQMQKNAQLYNGISMPNLQKYDPKNYQYQGDYTPDMAQAKTVSEDPTVRSAQLSALSKMAGLSNTGLSEVDQAGYEKAREMANQISHSGTAAALQNAASRGAAGSGLEFAMREQAAQDAAQRAQDAGLSQASDSARQRALYTQAYGQGLQNLRGQDYTANAGNANILNQFNQMNTQARNQAQTYNLQNRQNVSNMNTAGQNQAQLQNNAIAEQGFTNQLQKAGGQAGANTAVAQGYAAQDAANQSARNSNTGLLAGVGAANGWFTSPKKQPGTNMGSTTADTVPDFSSYA